MFFERLSAATQISAGTQDSNGGNNFSLILVLLVAAGALIYLVFKMVSSKRIKGPRKKAEWKPVITADEVVAKRFQPTKVRAGYDQDEVDQFLDRAVQELQRLQAENEGLQRLQLDPLSPPVFMTDPLLTPDQVIQQRFQETKFRAGYTQDEVDDFVDKIVHGLRDFTARNAEIRGRISGNIR